MERTIKPEALLSNLADKHLIDVRRKADLDTSSEALPGATWYDPEKTCRVGQEPAPRQARCPLLRARRISVEWGCRCPSGTGHQCLLHRRRHRRLEVGQWCTGEQNVTKRCVMPAAAATRFSERTSDKP
jgi:hypothetical protein